MKAPVSSHAFPAQLVIEVTVGVDVGSGTGVVDGAEGLGTDPLVAGGVKNESFTVFAGIVFANIGEKICSGEYFFRKSSG